MSVVLDASAVLALIEGEIGGSAVVPMIEGALITTVNYAEVGTRMIDRGHAPEMIYDDLLPLGMVVVPFDVNLARAAYGLRHETRSAGLSLGDRACLALAIREGLPAVTTDRAWARIDAGCEIRLIR